MAILKAPLLSLRASSQLGKAIAYRSMRGRNVACAYARPSDPKSAAQLIQRQKVNRTLLFWQRMGITDDIVDGWYRYAKYLRKPWAAYQAFMHFNTLWSLTDVNVAPQRMVYMNWNPGMHAQIQFYDINTQIPNTSRVYTYLYAGPAPDNLCFRKSERVGLGGLMTWIIDEITSLPVFFQVTLRTGEPITGIIKFNP